MKRTRPPINNHNPHVDEDITILLDLQARLQEGARNSDLRSAGLLLTKKEVDVLYGIISATLDYHKMTKK